MPGSSLVEATRPAGRSIVDTISHTRPARLIRTTSWPTTLRTVNFMQNSMRPLPFQRARSVGAVLFAATAVFAATACGGEPGTDTASGDFPMSVSNCGREVVIEQPPQRIMAIGGEAASAVWAAGGTDRISTFGALDGEPLGAAADDLAKIRTIKVPGSGEITREAIIAEQPDLVVTFGLNTTSPEELTTVGIPTLIVSGRCDTGGAAENAAGYSAMQAMYDDITTYGRLLGTQEQAAAAVADLQKRVQAVAEQTQRGEPRPAAALFVSGSGNSLGAYGSLSMVHEQLELLGLRNIFRDTRQRYFEPNVDTLINAQPEVIIALYQASDNTAESTHAALANRAELAAVPAVAEGRVLAIDFFYSGNGILAVDGLTRLADQLESRA